MYWGGNPLHGYVLPGHASMIGPKVHASPLVASTRARPPCQGVCRDVRAFRRWRVEKHTAAREGETTRACPATCGTRALCDPMGTFPLTAGQCRPEVKRTPLPAPTH